MEVNGKRKRECLIVVGNILGRNMVDLKVWKKIIIRIDF
jgi:hypothetical protein